MRNLFVLVCFCFLLIFVACGSKTKTTSSAPKAPEIRVLTLGDTIVNEAFGDCVLKGNQEQSTVSCKKNIKMVFAMGVRTGENAELNGVQIIRESPTLYSFTLERAKGTSPFEFTLEDGSVSSIILVLN